MKKYKQLWLPFREWTPEARKIANQRAWERFIAEHHRITAEEKNALPKGIRLARFVPRAECQQCRLAAEDHRLVPQGTILVCIKDMWRVMKGGEQDD